VVFCDRLLTIGGLTNHVQGWVARKELANGLANMFVVIYNEQPY